MKILVSASTDLHPSLRALVARENRLDELVAYTTDAPTGAVPYLRVADQRITLRPDWQDATPPVLLPELPFGEAAFLGAIFFGLGNYQKAIEYLEGGAAAAAALAEALRVGTPLTDTGLNDDGTAVYWHNEAVARHYGEWTPPPAFEAVVEAYTRAHALADHPLTPAFTAKHHATLLADAGEYQSAEALLEAALATNHPAPVAFSLKALLCLVWKNQLSPPYDQARLKRLRDLLRETLNHYKTTGQKISEALLLLDAAQIASLSESFAESLGYLNRALLLLEVEEQTELVADAQFRKGLLLFSWSQNGQPQFVRAALDAFKAALKVFRRENAPAIFADIHHYLGILYAEVPDDAKKKSVWAAVSVSSFNEALNFYNRADFPYEYATICHHFGNAYAVYPPAVRSDNFEKALEWYGKALRVRTAAEYPMERALTLNNYLEASWQASNPDEGFNAERFKDMQQKAQELRALAVDEDMRRAAGEHLRQLAKLKTQYTS